MFGGMPMLRPSPLVTLALGATLLGCNHASTPASAGPAPFTSANPFASASPLLYQAPPFDRIHDADYQPAVEEGMRRQLAEVAGISGSTRCRHSWSSATTATSCAPARCSRSRTRQRCAP